MKSILTLVLILSNISIFCQIDSIYDQGVYRTFILHLPENYNSNNEYPLVLNLHGLGSTAFEQLLYSAFNEVANEEEFIVVYADAIDNNWDLFGSRDVTFLSNLIDTIRNRYSTNECLFSMGMSQGGFLSYKLACELDHPLTAIAVVTGAMLTFWQDNCGVAGTMPVMHFHGTDDNTVLYEGTFGISPAEETAQWWANNNSCDPTPTITALPDIDPNDESTAERHQYSNCDDNADVVLYKIINGGHTWPGAIHIPTLGVTNQDINASELIGDFFALQCQRTTAIEHPAHETLKFFPNPAGNEIYINFPFDDKLLVIFDQSGRKVLEHDISKAVETIDIHHLMDGIYFMITYAEDNIATFSKLVICHGGQ